MNGVKMVAAVAAMILAHQGGTVEAQLAYPGVGYSNPAPYGYQINNGRIGSGYQPSFGLNRQSYRPPAPLTVTDFNPLISAITQVPGWYGTPGGHHPASHMNRPKPTIAYDNLLGPGGKVLWPSTAPDGPARKSAEEAVKLAVEEHDKYGQATVRKVADARNKLTEYLHDALPPLKTRNRADGDGLEKFVVELQKTLATLAVNY